MGVNGVYPILDGREISIFDAATCCWMSVDDAKRLMPGWDGQRLSLRQAYGLQVAARLHEFGLTGFNLGRAGHVAVKDWDGRSARWLAIRADTVRAWSVSAKPPSGPAVVLVDVLAARRDFDEAARLEAIRREPKTIKRRASA